MRVISLRPRSYISAIRRLTASAPSKGATLATMPTNDDNPVLPHPGSKNVVQTCFVGAKGDRIQSGIMIPKKPQI